ncbi:MAG: MAPEG family protein [Gammaproteobacteria bacterium]|jgi:uncharacterized MAPEG superfamily protein
MNTELTYLAYVTILTSLLWIPYIINTVSVRGLKDAVGYTNEQKPIAPWASRMKCAHYNAIENLVVFASLVLIANTMGISSNGIQAACVVYFWARVAHAISYTMAIPLARTLSFAAGFLSQMCIAWHIIAA